MKRHMTVLVAALAVSAPAAAQEPAQPVPERPRMQMGPRMQERMQERMGQRGRMRGEMMREMRGHMAEMTRTHALQPARLLQRREALGLTEQQVTRLTELAERASAEREAAQEQHRTARRQLAEAMNATAPDQRAIETQFRAAHEAMGRVQWAHMKAALDARAVLTEVQRARVDGWTDAVRQRVRGRRPAPAGSGGH